MWHLIFLHYKNRCFTSSWITKWCKVQGYAINLIFFLKFSTNKFSLVISTLFLWRTLKSCLKHSNVWKYIFSNFKGPKTNQIQKLEHPSKEINWENLFESLNKKILEPKSKDKVVKKLFIQVHFGSLLSCLQTAWRLLISIFLSKSIQFWKSI